MPSTPTTTAGPCTKVSGTSNEWTTCSQTHSDVVVSGTVENQGIFYDRFEHVVLISAPFHVLIERVTNRTNNPYGSTHADRDEIAHYIATVEPLLRRHATLEVDGQRPASELAGVIAELITAS